MNLLTHRQSQVLAMIKSFVEAHGCAPTSREIQKHFGFASQTGAMHHIRALGKKGAIDWAAGRGRTLCVGRVSSLPPALKSRFTYFFFDEVTGKVKIGCSSNIERRKVELETAFPCKLTVIGVLPADKWPEPLVHKRFESDRLRGEWFNYTRAIREFLTSQKEARA